MTIPYSSYTGDGTQELFPVAFPYLAREHVHATVNGASVSFLFENDTNIRLSPAPANGTTVIIKRVTPTGAPVDFQDASTLPARDLNTSFNHARFIAEESALVSGSGAADAALTASAKALEAEGHANAAAAHELTVLDATDDAIAARDAASGFASTASSASLAAQDAATDAGVQATSAASAKGSAAASADTASAASTAAVDARDEVLEFLDATKVRTLRSFGAVGDTVIGSGGEFVSGTDDTAALQAAVAWMNGHPERSLKGNMGDVHLLNAPLTGSGHFNMDMGGCVFFKNLNSLAISWSATQYGPFPLTADYTAGSTRVYAAPSLIAKPGTIMKVLSDAVDPADRDEGSNAGQYRTGEFFIVGEGSALTWVEMTKPLTFTEGIDPTSTGGDESRVDSYTTALNARLVYADASDTFILRNGRIQSDAGNAASWKVGHVSISGFVRPQIDNMEFARGYGIGIKLSGTYSAVVKDCYAEFLEDNTPNGQYGYAVADAGYGSVIDNLRVHNVRHGYTSGVATLTANSSDVGLCLQAGRTVGGSVRNGSGTSGDVAPFDTHHSSDFTTFTDVIVTEAQKGINLRGRRNYIRGLRARACSNGVSTLTEYASGSPDDDLWTAGKEYEDMSSASFVDMDIVCDELPLYSSYSFVKYGGQCSYNVKDHAFVTNQGGSVILTGHHEMISAPTGVSVSHSHAGCVTVTTTNAAMTSAFARATTIVEGTVIIDASAAVTPGIVGLFLGDNTTVIVRGRLKIKLPAGATYASLGSGSDLRCEGEGVIEVGVDGAADSTLFDPSLMSNQRVRAIDGSAWWDDVADRQYPVVTAKEDNETFSVVTTGSESAAYTPDGQKFWNEMHARGSGRARLRMSGRKVGAADTCRVVIRGNNSNYVGYFEISASHEWWDLDLEVTVRSGGEYLYHGVLRNQTSQEDEAGTDSKVRLLRKAETQAPNSVSNVPFIVHFQADVSGGDTIYIDNYEVSSDFGGSF